MSIVTLHSHLIPYPISPLAGTKNLIVAKSSRLEIFDLTSEGLVPVLDTNIYGRIAALKVIRFPVRQRFGYRCNCLSMLRRGRRGRGGALAN